VKRACIEPQEVPVVLALPDQDPRRRHLDTCLHCRALAHAYREFMDPTDPGSLPDLEAVDAELKNRLAAVLEGEFASPRTSRPPLRNRLVAGRTPRARAWLAMAAVLAVCAGVFLARDAVLLRDARLPGGTGLARGEADAPVGALDVAWVRDGDRWQLQWIPLAAVDATVVVFFDASLREVGRTTGSTAPALLAAAEVPATARYLQVLAVAAGDTVARSAILAARPDGS